MRKIPAIVLSLIMLLTCLFPAGTLALTDAEKDAAFAAALGELEDYLENPEVPGRSLDACIAAFEALGKYNFSDSFALFASALQTIEAGGFNRMLDASLRLLDTPEFTKYIEELDSPVLCTPEQLVSYKNARQAEAKGNISEAMAQYENCRQFYDSRSRCLLLEEAVCAEAYEKGTALFNEGDLAGAYCTLQECKGYKMTDTVLEMIVEELGYVPSSPGEVPAQEQAADKPADAAAETEIEALMASAMELYKAENYAEAFPLFLQAAERGDAEAQCRLADCYYYGQGTAIDYERTFYWSEKAAAQEYPEGLWNLGYLSETGEGTVQDYDASISWYRRAAENGYLEAQMKLGKYYHTGKLTEKDDAESLKWYRMAAEQGDAETKLKISRILLQGENAEKNVEEGVKWLEAAAEEGSAEAMYSLALQYAYGESVPQDYEKERYWLFEAAKLENPYAQHVIGQNYIYGMDGFEINYEEGVKWLKKSAENGFIGGCDQLALCYEQGIGVDKDLDKAIYWFRKAVYDRWIEDALRYEKKQLSGAKVGSIVLFGAYEQDNRSYSIEENAVAAKEESIEWIVLKKEKTRVLLISRYALDCLPYNEQRGDTTWETASLRNWLNGEFFEKAFLPEEQKLIQSITVKTGNGWENTPGGRDTKDRVFILENDEMYKLFGNDASKWQCAPTEYAKERGVMYSNSEQTEEGLGTCRYWSRTPGFYQDEATNVEYSYKTISAQFVNSSGIGVRPAIWVKIS